MADTVADVLVRASQLLQDDNQVRFTPQKLMLWVNDGIRKVIDLQPLAHFKQESITTEPGVQQTLPADCNVLIDVLKSGGGRVSEANPLQLDAEQPGWRDADEEDYAVHYIRPAPGTPFMEVYPPQTGGEELLIRYPYYPDDLVGEDDEIPIAPIYRAALVNFVCFRALDEDTNNAVNAERAAKHYELFRAEIS